MHEIRNVTQCLDLWTQQQDLTTCTLPAATGQQYAGRVLAWRAGSAGSSPTGGQALVLYDDGEDEWLDPSQEPGVQWHAPQPGTASCTAAGIPAGEPAHWVNMPRLELSGSPASAAVLCILRRAKPHTKSAQRVLFVLCHTHLASAHVLHVLQGRACQGAGLLWAGAWGCSGRATRRSTMGRSPATRPPVTVTPSCTLMVRRLERPAPLQGRHEANIVTCTYVEDVAACTCACDVCCGKSRQCAETTALRCLPCCPFLTVLAHAALNVLQASRSPSALPRRA